MKELKTLGLSCLSTKKMEETVSQACYLLLVSSCEQSKKKKVQMRPGVIDKKCHPGGLPETDILLSMALERINVTHS